MRVALVAVVATGAAACASSSAPDGILSRSGNYYLAVEAGMAVIPVAAIQSVTDPAEVSAGLTNELYQALLVSLPGTPLVSPERSIYLMDEAGEDGYSRVRNLHRRLVRGDEVDGQELVGISKDLQHRFLLVTWAGEGLGEGIQDIAYDDYTTVTRSWDVRRFSYEQITGRLEGVVLDLWEDEILWRGAVDYKTARLYGENGAIRKEVERTRADAAIRFADLVARL